LLTLVFYGGCRIKDKKIIGAAVFRYFGEENTLDIYFRK